MKTGEAMRLLVRAADYFSSAETTPDKDWFKDFYLLTGEHMVLTDEGWEFGASKEDIIAWAEEDARRSGVEYEDPILDEINAPG